MLIEMGIMGLTGMLLSEMIDLPQLFKYGMSEIEFKRRVKLQPSNTKLILGVDEKGEIIDVDCAVDGHVLICGLSLCGKSRMAEYFLRDKKNVVILNAFKKDFTVLKQAKRINGTKEIMNFLQTVLEGREEISSNEIKEPLFILIDEILVLSSKSKDAMKAISSLLADARHYGVFIIALTQEANKDVISCKNLFNIRVCMTMIDDSAFKVVLGAGIKDTFEIPKPREFIVFDNKGLRKGRTLDIKHDNEIEVEEIVAAQEIKELDSDIKKEEIKEAEIIEEVESVIETESIDLSYINLVKEEIRNKPLSELLNEVENIKEVKTKKATKKK